MLVCNPFRGIGLEALAFEVANTILIDPRAQAGPGIQDYLVGEVGGFGVEGDQTGTGQGVQGGIGGIDCLPE